MNKSTTKKLEEMLLNTDNEDSLNKYIEKITQEHPLDTFANYFQSFLDRNGKDRSEVCEDSGIERSYFYHILSGSKKPGRDKILRMCIAAGMSVEETEHARLFINTCG